MVHQQASAFVYASDIEEDEDLDYLGSFDTHIVGIQYYTGTVNRNEMVLMKREPNNAYDRNAIRVDNIRHQMVGHLNRQIVQALSPLIDNGKLAIEGTVPHGHNNKYKMPCAVYCYGKLADAHLVARAIQRAGAGWEPASYRSSAGGARDGGGAGSSHGAGPSASQRHAEPASRRISASEVARRVESVIDGLMKDEGARPIAEASSAVATHLYVHQKEALAWMIAKENEDSLPVFWENARSGGGYLHTLCNFSQQERPSPMRGGILADDMGLGKSLTTIALICTNAPGGPLAGGKNKQKTHPLANTPFVDDNDGEDEKATTEHISKRQRRSKAALKSGAALHPTAVKKRQKSSTSEAAKGSHKSEVEASPAQAAGPSAASNKGNRDGPRGTLILCPLSVLASWEQQIVEHTVPGAVRVYLYHGSQRDRRTTFLSNQDIVVSTYSTLQAEHREKSRNGLLGVKWYRVVADEGHVLKNAATQTAEAARRLKTERRWILSGTPIQNSLKDLHGLLGFLGLEPLTDKSLFRRTIERPVTEGNADGIRRLQALVGALALRRTKETRRNGHLLVTLPRKSVFEVLVKLDAEGRAKYGRWQAAGTAMVQRHLANNTLLQNFTTVLTMLLRLRQIAADPSLVTDEDPEVLYQMQQHTAATSHAVASRLDEATKTRLLATLQAGMEGECPVCLDPLSADPAITRCAHIFCNTCIRAVIARDKPTCPLCRAHVEEGDLLELPPPPPTPAVETPPDGAAAVAAAVADGGSGATIGPKVAALLGRLAASDPSERHVVFSQFTSMLDNIGAGLTSAGHSFCRLDGSTSAPRRAAMLREFALPTGPRVFLVSLKAGGVGLNLTRANHCHLLDPWWNPAVEEQAADRVHRLGQTKPVSIWRYITEDTIERRMLQLQEHKRELMKSAFERRSAAQTREMRVNDVRILMDLSG